MEYRIDLDRYAQRIAYDLPFRSDLECLTALCAHHVSHIPFENCGVLLDHPVRLDAESLQRKMIDEERGGYCFEQNGLLLEVLQQIGFEARPLSARVRIGVDRHTPSPRSHMFIVVRLDGADWVVDCGIGALSLAAPIRWELNAEQQTPHEPRRIVKDGSRFFHQYERDGVWSDVYEFTGEEMPLVDRELSNWWTSTHPNSLFKQGLFCALPNAPGERKTLLNTRFHHRRGAEVLRSVLIHNSDDARGLLRREFGLDYGNDASFPLMESSDKEPETSHETTSTQYA